jgi:CP family cyanate transporter-like MFS transporter
VTTADVAAERRPRTALPGWLTLLGVVLVAMNLRPAIAALAPVLPDVRVDLDLSRGAAGLLTALPVLCFGVLAPAVAILGRRLGSERAVLLAMLALAAGIALRSGGGIVAVFAGTLVLGAAITVGNVLVPGLVKQYFPDNAGAVTGLYTAALTGGAALAAGLAAPVRDGLGLAWEPALLVWCLPALVAALVWTPQLRRRHAPEVTPTHGGVWRSPVAWALAVFMGAQALTFYAVLAWLPTLLQERGVSSTDAGWALAVYNLVGMGTSLVLPALATRRRDQLPYALLICLAWVVGLVGLAAAPGMYLVWAVVTGLAQGAGIALALTLIVVRARTPDVARQLSGMVQGVGYLLAASGPFLAGALRDASGGWTAPLAALVTVVGVMAVAAALGAARDRVVG